MIVTVFRSRLMPGVREDYLVLAERMNEIARTMPGYISHKGFFADDGERVTIVEFENEEGMRAWRMHPEHRAAQKEARATARPCAVRGGAPATMDGARRTPATPEWTP